MQVSWPHCIFTNRADHTALASSASEGSLLAGTNEQPWLEPGFFDQANRGHGKALSLRAAGVFSTTGTPTLIFQVRLGTTAGSTYLSGTSLGVSAAITTINNSSNVRWQLDMDIICNTPGIGTGNTTLSCNGSVRSPAGFASPFEYALEPTTPETATWTTTINNALLQYLNVSATWSASSASNTITLKDLILLCWN